MKLPRPASSAIFALGMSLLPAASSPAQSLLLTAEDFVVLAGTAVSIGGAGPTTLSNGNVGAANSISGIPPATIVNGSAITGGVIVGQALDDLITARNALSALASPPANNLSGVNGGNLATQILAPGVYTFNTAASLSLNGVLTLDAQGQNNVTWVINIGTELTTGANAAIQFINLGSNNGADNGLFWNAGSSITFGGDNIIAGNYLAGTSITFGTTLPANGSAGGRALALAGVSFAGAGTLDVLGGPGNGDMTGGLVLDEEGQLVPSGYVLLSANGTYVQGASTVILRNGTLFNTANVVIDGNSSDTTPGSPASLTVFRTIASLTGTNTYTGGTVVDAGTLTTGSANLPVGGNVSLIDSNATGTSGVLIFDQATNGTYTGVISGTGSVTKQGTGALVLTNTHTYTGGTFLDEGTLALNNGIIGTTTVANGAFLRGTGGINGNLVNNGTVSPGFSPGTLVIAGDFTQGPAGTLEIELASPIDFDRLIIGGTATLDGTLAVIALDGYDPVNDSFTFLTAGGGVSGIFSTVTSAPSAARTPVVTYNANDVTLTFVQTPFVTFAGTPNQGAVGAGVQNDPAITAALNNIPLAGQLTAALNALSPQGYGIWSDIAFARALTLSGRLAHDHGALPGHDNYYFQAGQSRHRVKGNADIGSIDFNSDSGLVGGDHALNESLTVGAFLDFTDTDSGLGSPGSTTSAKSIMPGIRAAWNRDAWFVYTALGYGFDKYKSTRAITFPGAAATATSSTHGRQWLADITAGRRFTAGNVTVSPFIGALISKWKADGFTETGGGTFNTTVGSQSARSLRTQAGLEAALDLNLGTVLLRPRVRAAWIHELENDSRPINATTAGGSSYTVMTQNPERDSLRTSAGFDLGLTRGLMLYADYAMQTGANTRVTGAWNAGLAFSF